MQDRDQDQQRMTTGEIAGQEYRRENQQGTAQVESAEVTAEQNDRGRAPVPTNDVAADTQSGRVPGSPMDPKGLEVNQSGAAVTSERRDRDEAHSGEPRSEGARAIAENERADAREHEGKVVSLFPSNEAETFRSKWDSIQTGFVDAPRHAVEQADQLVAEAMQKLAGTFADERASLERQWRQRDNVSTEDLRVALRRYRSFFDRLMAA